MSNTMIPGQGRLYAIYLCQANHAVVSQCTSTSACLLQATASNEDIMLRDKGICRVAAQGGKLDSSSSRQTGAQAAGTDTLSAAQKCL